ncbi:hypothetical protein JRO89_XS02G0133500 [Xanthoceras sorbifolium]|uniref:Transposase n=1 Tax=Xanthoceras sorbifolium TaxID=99658 RepID=A0ABQ8IFU4_9ROSI|nr:hypothetical protein JRO89_XS02G0133500 [Xanthoceras sorbifolium]
MHARFKGDLNGLYVWAAANCSNRAYFQVEMDKLRAVSPTAYEYMMGIPLKHWSVHAFDLHVKSAHTINNMTEAFNSWVDNCRSVPALLLVESIRRKMMKKIGHCEINAWEELNRKLKERLKARTSFYKDPDLPSEMRDKHRYKLSKSFDGHKEIVLVAKPIEQGLALQRVHKQGIRWKMNLRCPSIPFYGILSYSISFASVLNLPPRVSSSSIARGRGDSSTTYSNIF